MLHPFVELGGGIIRQLLISAAPIILQRLKMHSCYAPIKIGLVFLLAFNRAAGVTHQAHFCITSPKKRCYKN